MIPFHDLRPVHEHLQSELVEATQRVLASGWYVLGPEVERFELQIADVVGVTQAVGVANGTDAIELGLRALGVSPGAEVITVAHTAIPTVAAIERAGGRPVFVDIDQSTYTLDPAALAGAITSRTEAIVPVHLYGHPVDMTAVMDLARRHQLAVVEDCAQALGAKHDGRPVGSFGHAAALSFYPTKTLGACGDAGAVATGDAEVADRVRRLRAYGQRRRDECFERGINSRLDELQAALLSVKLEHLPGDRACREQLAAIYNTSLQGVVTPPIDTRAQHAHCLYVVRHPHRDRLRAALDSQQIETLVHYPRPVHLQPAYEDLGYQLGTLPVTEAAANEVLSLPLYWGLTAEDVRRVTQVMNDCLSGVGA